MAYIGPEPNPGQNREVDDISSSFNGSTTAFTLQVSSQNVSPGSSNAIIVSLGGVVQNPGTDYTVAASTLTFTTAPASGLSFFGLVLGQQVDIQSLADGTSPTMSAPSITGDLSIADKIVHTGDTNNAIRFPAADTITAETGGSERVRVDSSGQVGIGTTSPAHKLHVEGSATGVISAKQTTNNGGFNIYEGDASDGTTKFYVTHNGRVGAADGIIFGTDTAADNILNDYEEGTFNPTLQNGNNGYRFQYGYYVKIGAAVHFTAFIEVSATPPSSNIAIGGLPFTSLNVNNANAYVFPMLTNRTNFGTSGQMNARFYMATNDTFATLYYPVNSSSSNFQTVNANNMNAANASNIWMSGTYFTAS